MTQRQYTDRYEADNTATHTTAGASMLLSNSREQLQELVSKYRREDLIRRVREYVPGSGAADRSIYADRSDDYWFGIDKIRVTYALGRLDESNPAWKQSPTRRAPMSKHWAKLEGHGGNPIHVSL